MSRFYGYRAPSQRMGFVWLAPVVQLIGGALQSHPVDAAPIGLPQRDSTVPILLAVGGVAALAGLGYLLVKS